MLTIGFAATWFVLFGNSSLSAFGFTSVDVTRKNTSSKKTMSVIEDMLNDGSTFERRLIDIFF
jgi:hypothetical protein